SAFMRSTIEVRHSSFSCLAATALSRIGATSTVFPGEEAGAAAAIVPPPPAGAPPLELAPPVGAALAVWPKIALLIFSTMLIACSKWTSILGEGWKDPTCSSGCQPFARLHRVRTAGKT